MENIKCKAVKLVLRPNSSCLNFTHRFDAVVKYSRKSATSLVTSACPSDFMIQDKGKAVRMFNEVSRQDDVW